MILITGASGNIGSEVLKQAAAGLQIRAAFQSRDKVGGAPAGIDTVLMDYTRPETVRAALRGVQRIFPSARRRRTSWTSMAASSRNARAPV